MAKAAKSAGKKSSSKKTLTKAQFIAHLAEKTGLTKKQVDQVMETLVETVKEQVGSKGPGKIVIPGLARVTLTQVKAVKGGEERINRLTGATYITKDRPAFNKVNVRPVKSIKEALK